MTVKIEQRKLLDLLEAYFKLAALESGGVDNWEWYGDSLCQYLEEDEMNKTQDDYEDCINHFSRNVYYDLATEVVKLINGVLDKIYHEEVNE